MHGLQACTLGSVRARCPPPMLALWVGMLGRPGQVPQWPCGQREQSCLLVSLQVCVLNSVAYGEREEKQDWEQHLDKCILLTNTQVSHDIEHACQQIVLQIAHRCYLDKCFVLPSAR